MDEDLMKKCMRVIHKYIDVQDVDIREQVARGAANFSSCL